jgi:acyl-CoA reductase-like NAD-dependent aldehyde dehydrogenase
MNRYFYNAPSRSKKPGKVATATSQLKKPRATNALEVFSRDRQEEITQRMAEKRSTSVTNNLSAYKKSQQELWSATEPETRAAYEEKAAERNEKIKNGPTEEDIYECGFSLFPEI